MILQSILLSVVIEFEQNIYEVAEDIGLDNFALRVCLRAVNVASERNITLHTFPIDSATGE